MSYPVDPLVIGLDIGHSNVKYASPFQRGHFPSIYAMEEPGISFEGLSAANDFVIEIEENRYAIGRSASRLGSIPVRTLDRRRVLSVDYKILLAAALVAGCQYPKGNGEFAIFDGQIAPVLSLPIEWYEKRQKVKEYIAGWVNVTYRNQTLSYYMPAENISILPEGFGALLTDISDDQGRAIMNTYDKKTVGVIDVGMKTTDLSFFDDLQIVPSKTRGFDVGLSNALLMMQRLANDEMQHHFSLEELDDALHGKRLMVGKTDITSQVLIWKEKAMSQIANAVKGDVSSLWQGGNDAEYLRLNGGTGEYIYADMVEAFSHLTLVEDPAMANADGALLWALRKARDRNAVKP